MNSFKSGAGILSIANTVIEISLFVYLLKRVNSVSNELDDKFKDIETVAKKIVEVDGKTSQLGNGMQEVVKALKDFNILKNQLVGAINELHKDKAETDARLEQVESHMDLIIQALEKNNIQVDMPKPKPASRFGRQHVVMDSSEKKVSFKKPVGNKKIFEEPAEEGADENQEEEDTEALQAIKDFRKSRR